MTLEEKHMDLFTVGNDYHIAHCIASDLRMGAGIAVPMQRKFHLRGKIESSGDNLDAPTCVLTGRVFNLITKKRSTGKPTYLSLRAALEKMKELVVSHGVKKIAMPKIGCGLDRLQWGKVREMLHDLFSDVDVEILVVFI